MTDNCLTQKIVFVAGTNPFPCQFCPDNNHDALECENKVNSQRIKRVIDLLTLPKLLLERFIQCGDPYNLNKLQKITKEFNYMIPKVTYKTFPRLALEPVNQIINNALVLNYNPQTVSSDVIPGDFIVTKIVTIRQGKIGNVQLLMDKKVYLKPESLHVMESELSLDEFKFLILYGKTKNIQFFNTTVEPPPSIWDVISCTREATTLILDIKNFILPSTWVQDFNIDGAKKMNDCSFYNVGLTFDVAYFDKFIQDRMASTRRINKHGDNVTQNHLSLKLNPKKYEPVARKKIIKEIVNYLNPLFTRVSEPEFRSYFPNEKVEIGVMPTTVEKGPKTRNLYFVASRCLKPRHGTKRKTSSPGKSKPKIKRENDADDSG